VTSADLEALDLSSSLDWSDCLAGSSRQSARPQRHLLVNRTTDLSAIDDSSEETSYVLAETQEGGDHIDSTRCLEGSDLPYSSHTVFITVW
jgi:hypothetical protein